ncbi:MAG: complex I NDUFA9 subunit family protein [Thermoleophilaceae bacterium]
MILLTGATGNVGSGVLRRLVAADQRVRCLVRDPRRLGSERVQVQIALGDLADPSSFRNALRGIDTVIHLAASIRDGPRASIEELNGVATLRLLRAAERAGAGRFVFFSALGASGHAQPRFLRAKALAESAVTGGSIPSIVFAPSIIYSPFDAWMTLMRHLSLLPAMPVSGSGQALYQPISAFDAAECLIAALARESPRPRYELAGPQTLSYDDIVRTALRAFRRRRRVMHLPLPLVRAGLRATQTVMHQRAFATPEEAELMEVSMTTPRGPEDARSLGVDPRPMSAVLAAG